MMRIKWILLFLALLFFNKEVVFSQAPFKLIVQLPENMDAKKIEIYFNNGKVSKHFNNFSSTIDNKIVFIDSFYFLYGTLNIQYPQNDGRIYGDIFFVKDSFAAITINKFDTISSPFNNCSLYNVFDFKKERAAMNDWDSAIRKKTENYTNLNYDRLFKKVDTAIFSYYSNILRRDLSIDRLKYIMKHPNSYYSFYMFRKDVVLYSKLSPDSLLNIFNTIFPKEFKNSDEGTYVSEYLNGTRSLINQGIDYTFTDIKGKSTSLSSFRNKKYVLLHFWATWCGPCREEMPLIKEIYNKFGSKDLELISFARESDKYSDFLTAIQKYDMHWIQVYNNVDFYNKIGGVGVPRICLIDKTGKIIYDNANSKDEEPIRLVKLRKLLSEVIN